ncbi:hypothetical protein DWX97_02205 [Bacteroides cellulosilyticus]|mgnify:FL=1|jgi:hypothetical protein|uniref:6-bladed beta-propeller n=2 Tax=Bacteroides cellulosilyticus TaxID=246787 RepID=A0A412IPP0_9BACE|nr:hypothetical protein DWX97_02205 [Bacteroides cellulosilyticus]
MGNFTNRDILDNDTNYAKQNKMRNSKQFLSILIALSLSACSSKDDSIFSDFTRTVDLQLLDSLDLEKMEILNPHYIHYKDSFLIFHSMAGKKKLEFWNLRSDLVTVRNVIGQGVDEMPRYVTVDTDHPASFRFADYRRGRIYEMDLEMLQEDTTTKHSLVYELPIKEGDTPLRFYETGNHIFGIGLFSEGRIYSFDKRTNKVMTCMDYPAHESIEPLDQRHKGALFSGTIMAGNQNTLVLACFGLIDFYEILSDGGLRLKQERHYSFPKFQTAETGRTVTFDRDDIYAISDIDSDERFIYLLYSGKNVREKGNDAYNCSHLLVYDWEGNPIVHCLLSKSLYGFGIGRGILYGLSREVNPIVYVYSLKDILQIE